MLRNIRYLPLSRIRELSLLVIQQYNKKDHLFSHLGHPFDSPLSPSSFNILKDFEAHLLPSRRFSSNSPQNATILAPASNLRDWLTLIEGVKDVLVQFTKNRDTGAEKRTKEVTKAHEIVDRNKLVFGSLAFSDLDALIPFTVSVSELGACIQAINCFP